MRSLVAMVLSFSVPIGVGVFVACGPPSSFENITGGPPVQEAGADSATLPLAPDGALAAPRPIAPLSTSWINGSRPHFRWELVTQGTVGAQVTVCPDFACADPAKNKTFSAAGRELVLPEDLAPGVWYWHLVSTTSASYGTDQKSATWSMLVRGGNGAGYPSGSFVDPNGDGIPDLLVSVATVPAEAGGTPFGYYLFFGTKADDVTALNTESNVDGVEQTSQIVQVFATTSPNATVTSTDVDGDGASELLVADVGVVPPSTTALPYLDLVQGSRAGFGVSFAWNLASPILPALDVLPSVVAPGDLDQDGHGDLLASTRTETVAFYGANDGLATLGFFTILPKDAPLDAGLLPLPANPIAQWGFDYDSDGFADIVATSYFVGSPFTIMRGIGDREYDTQATRFAEGTPVTTPPTAYTSGDIDGDGKTDLVFVTTLAAKAAVCVFGGSEAPLLANLVCYAPDPPPAGFASSIATADLDGDGKDEILVGSSAGVDVLTRPTPPHLVAEHLALDYGTALTVMHPGMTGTPAIWAAQRADGSSFALFRGKIQARVIPAAPLAPAVTKFANGIR